MLSGWSEARNHCSNSADGPASSAGEAQSALAGKDGYRLDRIWQDSRRVPKSHGLYWSIVVYIGFIWVYMLFLGVNIGLEHWFIRSWWSCWPTFFLLSLRGLSPWPIGFQPTIIGQWRSMKDNDDGSLQIWGAKNHQTSPQRWHGLQPSGRAPRKNSGITDKD